MTAEIAVVNEKRWTLPDGMAQVGEYMTGDEREPVVFQFQLKQNPMTRKQLEAVRDLIVRALEGSPEARIVAPPPGLASRLVK